METQREKYSVTAKQLATLHGVTINSINKWTRQGAFKYARRNTPQGRFLYHRMHLEDSMGMVKNRLKEKTYANQTTMIIRDVSHKKDTDIIRSRDVMALVDRVLDLEKQINKLTTRLERYEQLAAYSAATELRL
jgi:hypothetical protein